MISMGRVWDDAMGVLARHRGAVLLVAALGIFVPGAISGLANLHAPIATAEQKTLISLLGLVTTIATVWGQLSLSALALSADDAARAGSALAIGLRRLPAMLLVVLVILLALVVIGVPVIVLMVAGGVDFAALSAGTPGATISPGAGLGIAAYVILLVPVLLFLAARIALTTPVVVAERRNIGAIGRSWALTRGLTFKLAGLIILYTVIALVTLAATQFVLGGLLLLVWGNGEAVNAATVVTALAVAVVTAILSTISTVFVARLYLAVSHTGDGELPLETEMPRG